MNEHSRLNLSQAVTSVHQPFEPSSSISFLPAPRSTYKRFIAKLPRKQAESLFCRIDSINLIVELSLLPCRHLLRQRYQHYPEYNARVGKPVVQFLHLIRHVAFLPARNAFTLDHFAIQQNFSVALAFSAHDLRDKEQIPSIRSQSSALEP